jgi:hypothetical protein
VDWPRDGQRGSRTTAALFHTDDRWFRRSRIWRCYLERCWRQRKTTAALFCTDDRWLRGYHIWRCYLERCWRQRRWTYPRRLDETPGELWSSWSLTRGRVKALPFNTQCGAQLCTPHHTFMMGKAQDRNVLNHGQRLYVAPAYLLRHRGAWHTRDNV